MYVVPLAIFWKGSYLKSFELCKHYKFANANIVVVLKQLMAQNIVSELIDEWLMTSVQLLVCNGGVPYLVADKYLWTFEEIFAHNWQCQKRTLAPFIKEKQGNSFWNWDKKWAECVLKGFKNRKRAWRAISFQKLDITEMHIIFRLIRLKEHIFTYIWTLKTLVCLTTRTKQNMVLWKMANFKNRQKGRAIIC